jgi:hypothetical protein
MPCRTGRNERPGEIPGAQDLVATPFGSDARKRDRTEPREDDRCAQSNSACWAVPPLTAERQTQLLTGKMAD